MDKLRNITISTSDNFCYKAITVSANKNLDNINIRILKELEGSGKGDEIFIDLDKYDLKKLIYFLDKIDKTILI